MVNCTRLPVGRDVLVGPFGLLGAPDPDDRETVVAISLRDLGESTALTVDQGPFVTDARRALHEQGWTESLDRLQELIASRHWSGRDDVE